MNASRRMSAFMAALMILALSASPTWASGFRQGNLIGPLCNPTLGSEIVQEFPYGYTDEGRYLFIAGLYSWSTNEGYRWLGWSDWNYLDASDANSFQRTATWHHYPDGRLDVGWHWTIPAGTPQQWYVAYNLLYNTAAKTWWEPWYSPWLQC
jgi:hypothetical protein